jgi:hypothetical protein
MITSTCLAKRWHLLICSPLPMSAASCLCLLQDEYKHMLKERASGMYRWAAQQGTVSGARQGTAGRQGSDAAAAAAAGQPVGRAAG